MNLTDNEDTKFRLLNGSIKNVCNLCRLCLSEVVSNGAHFFDETYESRDIVQKVQFCTQIKINKNKYLPQNVCESCVFQLNNANNFRMKCVASELALQQYYLYLLDSQKPAELLFDTFKDIPDIKPSACVGSSDIINASPQHSTNKDVTKSVIIAKVEALEVKEEIVDNDNASHIRDTPIENIANMAEVGCQCLMCGKNLKSKASLARHIHSMHEKRKHEGQVTGFGAARRYHCDKCSYTTPHSQSMVYHVRTHSGERPYECECGKRFTQPASLAAHQKTHSVITHYTCSCCGKQFKFKNGYERHKLVHAAPAYRCSLCPKKLKSRRSLQAHMNRHNGVRNYSCEECGNTFVTANELLNHKRCHSGEKRFKCQLCPYTSCLKKGLIIHLKRHAGDRSYKCDLCEATCYTAGELKSHRRSHTHEKLYSCPMCNQRFVYSTSVNKHMRTLHGVKYIWNEKVDRRVIKTALSEVL